MIWLGPLQASGENKNFSTKPALKKLIQKNIPKDTLKGEKQVTPVGNSMGQFFQNHWKKLLAMGVLVATGLYMTKTLWNPTSELVIVNRISRGKMEDVYLSVKYSNGFNGNPLTEEEYKKWAERAVPTSKITDKDLVFPVSNAKTFKIRSPFSTKIEIESDTKGLKNRSEGLENRSEAYAKLNRVYDDKEFTNYFWRHQINTGQALSMGQFLEQKRTETPQNEFLLGGGRECPIDLEIKDYSVPTRSVHLNCKDRQNCFLE